MNSYWCAAFDPMNICLAYDDFPNRCMDCDALRGKSHSLLVKNETVKDNEQRAHGSAQV